MFMSLQNKGLAELEELASNLRMQIASNPNHSTMEKVVPAREEKKGLCGLGYRSVAQAVNVQCVALVSQ